MAQLSQVWTPVSGQSYKLEPIECQAKKNSHGQSSISGDNAQSPAPVVIKKYANRRLYDTTASCYITLDHLRQMVIDGVEFVVRDARTGEDLTRAVLTQIIMDEESRGGDHLLPVGFLRQLICFYGDSMKRMMLPDYLDVSMQAFVQNQERMLAYMRDNFGMVFPVGGLEDVNRRNMALFEQAMRMFSPFAAETKESSSQQASGSEVPKPPRFTNRRT